MPSLRIYKDNNRSIHFITCTVVDWYPLFNRHDRWKILENSLNYCVRNKGLIIYAYVFMIDHIHLLIESKDLIGFLRDFKKYTAYELMKNIKQTEPDKVKEFKKGDHYCIWQKTNLPLVVESEWFFIQKQCYIEQNPVKKGYVNSAEHWRYSSANPDGVVMLWDQVG